MVVQLVVSVLCRWLVHSRHGILFFTRGDIVVDFSVIHAIPVNDSFTFGRFVLWCALNLPSDMMRSITTIASQLKVWSHNVKTSLFLLQRLTHNSPGSRWGFWPAIFELHRRFTPVLIKSLSLGSWPEPQTWRSGLEVLEYYWHSFITSTKLLTLSPLGSCL